MVVPVGPAAPAVRVASAETAIAAQVQPPRAQTVIPVVTVEKVEPVESVEPVASVVWL
jgi:hypothetical protein